MLDLGVGEPDFDTPALVAAAGIAAIEAGKTRYPPNVGTPELRRAIAGALSAMSGGRPVDPERLVVSSGSKQSLFNACFTLFGPGDQVLIPSPAWVSYPQMVHLCRAEPVPVPATRSGASRSPSPTWSSTAPRRRAAHPLLAVQSHRLGLLGRRAASDRDGPARATSG